MAGTLHQGLLLLFQDDPWLAFDVLGIARPVEGTPVDRRSEIERDGPRRFTVRQGFPDLVLVYRDPSNRRRGVVITVEAQTEVDYDKRWMVPVYQSHLADDHRLPTWAVVVSLDETASGAMRAWARGYPPKFDVLLVDIESVSKAWLDDAARPTAAVLAGALHGYAGDLDAARRGFRAALSLPKPSAERHAMTVLAALPERQREQLIKELPVQEQDKWREVERRSGTYQVGRKEGREEGREALIELIFELLGERNVAVDSASEAKIRACEDLRTLQRWVRRSVHATSVAELLDA